MNEAKCERRGGRPAVMGRRASVLAIAIALASAMPQPLEPEIRPVAFEIYTGESNFTSGFKPHLRKHNIRAIATLEDPNLYSICLQAGLELLQSGRAADRSGAWGEAFTALAGAADSFAGAAARDPDNRRAAGNWGNALLEMGQVGSVAAL